MKPDSNTIFPLALRALTAALIACLALQGCASISAAREEYRQGWREAFVMKTDIGAAPVKYAERDCRQGQIASAGSSTFAVLSYMQGGRRVRYVASVPDGTQAAVGDAYRVNVKNCGSPWLAAAR